jgi:hypothetical protein
MVKKIRLLVDYEKTGSCNFSNYVFVEKVLLLIINKRRFNSRTFNAYEDFNKKLIVSNCSVFYKSSFS